MRVDNSTEEKKAVSISLINHRKTHKQDSFLRQICIIFGEAGNTIFLCFRSWKFSPRCSFPHTHFFIIIIPLCFCQPLRFH